MSERQTFYLTFGQRGLRDGWVEIDAPDYQQARGFVVDEYGRKWSNLYDRHDFDPDFYPRGPHGRVIV